MSQAMNSAIELTAFRGLPAWELLAANYLFMIQAGAWAMLAGCASRALGLKSFEPLRRWGLLAGTGLAMAAPLNLVAELLSPERFATLLYRVQPSSPLSWGTWAIITLNVLGLAECRSLFRNVSHASPMTSRLAFLAALGVVVYTWIDIDHAAGIPLWSGPWPSAALTASGAAAGLALCLGLVRLDNQEQPGPVIGMDLPDRSGAPDRPGRPDRFSGDQPSNAFAPRLAAALACAAAGTALLGWGLLRPWPALPDWPQGMALLVGSGLALLVASGLYMGGPRANRGTSLPWACLLALGGAWAMRVGLLAAGQAAALGRALGEPHLAGHAGILTAVAPMALWVLLMLGASGLTRFMPNPAMPEGGRP